MSLKPVDPFIQNPATCWNDALYIRIANMMDAAVDEVMDWTRDCHVFIKILEELNHVRSNSISPMIPQKGE
jgi:hypothetical protein